MDFFFRNIMHHAPFQNDTKHTMVGLRNEGGTLAALGTPELHEVV